LHAKKLRSTFGQTASLKFIIDIKTHEL
jgi:hypothetical protein